VQRMGLKIEGRRVHRGARIAAYSTGMPWRIVFSVTTRGSTNWSR
jgi:hypothetical protein